MNENNRKYLDYQGLKIYNEQIKQYFGNVDLVAGRVGLADRAIAFRDPSKIELTGAVTGDMSNWRGGNILINTKLTPLTGTHTISITGDAGGNAATASNFKDPKTIYLNGDVKGQAAGGTSGEGWSINDIAIQDGVVTNAKLAGGITNDKLVNHSITIGTTKVDLGGTITTITADLIGDVTGNASTATRATQDSAGNIINEIYATKTYVDSKSAAIRFKGSVLTKADLPANPENGDVYNVTNDPDPLNNKSWIWSSTDNAWSVFGSTYGPATDIDLGLVKIEANSHITNNAGSISVTGTNVDDALGYKAIRTIKVNGDPIIMATDRSVNIPVPTDYATQEDIDNSFTYSNVTKGLGFDPINIVQVNGTALTKTNNTVNVDLTDYATKPWTTEQIEQKLTSLYIFKGSVLTYGDLLNIKEKVVGHTYNVIKGNDPTTEVPEWPAFSDGTNFAWDGDEWDALGGTLDLSAYYKKTEVDALLAQKAALTHSHNDLYYKKSEVDQKVADLQTWVNNRIVEYFQAAVETGAVDDIRTYSTAADFPKVGTPDIEYVDASTGTEYHWIVDSEEFGTGHYEAINATATDEEIEHLFD